MPYISSGDREGLDKILAKMTKLTAGELCYCIVRLLDHTFRFDARPGYSDLALVLGILESAKLEIYRRVVAPYEDEAIERNGDVFDLS